MSNSQIAKRYQLIKWALDERLRRLICAAEAKTLGQGGITTVSEATGVSRRAIHAGLKELECRNHDDKSSSSRIRRPGAGRKRIAEIDATLQADLDLLLNPVSQGNPDSPLRWTCKSLRTLSKELGEKGQKISHTHVGKLLVMLGYSLQLKNKAHEGPWQADRNTQFEHINQRVIHRLAQGEPVVSVDLKKKELISHFKNNGQKWCSTGEPTGVKLNEFIKEADLADLSIGCNLGSKDGWVSVDADFETAVFAVEAIRRWWQTAGSKAYPKADDLFIAADSDGSNDGYVRLWKPELQHLADEIGIPLRVCHCPSGTRKWNTIEDQPFAYFIMHWQGKALIGHDVVIRPITGKKTKTEIAAKRKSGRVKDPERSEILEDECASVKLAVDDFYEQWNYSIFPEKYL